MINSFINNLYVILPTLVVGSAILMPLTILVLSSMLRQLRSPASSLTWLLTIMLVPYIGIPLFWMFGERKFQKLSATKRRINLAKFSVGHDAVPSPLHAPAPRDDATDDYVPGNRMRLHANGEDAYADLMQLIDGARQSIEIQTFVLKADAVGKEILARMKTKAKEGVKVRLLVDGLGSLFLSHFRMRGLRKAGVEAHFIMPVWRIALFRRSNLRNHRKIIIIDGQQVFAGGRNIAKEYLGPMPMKKRWTDMSFVLEGPSVARYIEIFRSDWHFVTGQELEPTVVPSSVAPAGEQGAVVRVVPSGPDVDDDNIYLLMLSMILEATERLWIVTPYFIPNETLNTALRAAAKRGVDVRIVVPAKGDQILPDMARGPYLRYLKDAGAQVMLYEPALLHAKAVLVDNKLAAIGSANFDSRSMFLNFEVTSVVASGRELEEIEAWMKVMMAETRPGGKPLGALRGTLEGVARLLAPLL